MAETIDPPDGDDGDEKRNPFDPRKLRFSQRFSEGIDVRRVLTTVPFRKPHRQEFVRVHPAENMRIDTALLDFKEERQLYLVEPALWPALPGEANALYSIDDAGCRHALAGPFARRDRTFGSVEHLRT